MKTQEIPEIPKVDFQKQCKTQKILDILEIWGLGGYRKVGGWEGTMHSHLKFQKFQEPLVFAIVFENQPQESQESLVFLFSLIWRQENME